MSHLCGPRAAVDDTGRRGLVVSEDGPCAALLLDKLVHAGYTGMLTSRGGEVARLAHQHAPAFVVVQMDSAVRELRQ
jgi:hypothetical protein